MKQSHKTFALWILALLFVISIYQIFNSPPHLQTELKFPEFIQYVKDHKIKSVTFKGDREIFGEFVPDFQKGQRFKSIGDTNSASYQKIILDNGLVPNYVAEDKDNLWQHVLVSWMPMILLLVIFFFFVRQLQVGGGKALSFGKSRAKLQTGDQKKVTFKDVAGAEEAKEELVEIVDFLKDPKKYTRLGGKIPKGVLLMGPPGTGKTLLARAVAGEAGVPFFSISGSDFVEMFVGVGASRVRDLFEQGKKSAPCIIFIDEIDAVGRHRGAGLGGGHDEREQTLNQLLVEMDGFEGNEGIIIVAATNRADVLDPALLRPGRFDRRVSVSNPDVSGREDILKVHTRKTPMSDDVDLRVIARGTPGFSGADLANLVNEAALIAAKANQDRLLNTHFEEARDKVLMGPERRSMIISKQDRDTTAYHEAGHALMNMLLPGTDPIHKVTIVPRGRALGLTQMLPMYDQLNIDRKKAISTIKVLLSGRIAEEIIFGQMTTGASNDFERATDLARKMVCEWGMDDDIGPMVISKRDENVFLGRDFGRNNDHSQSLLELSDRKIKMILDENYREAKEILSKHTDVLHRFALALVEFEVLEFEQLQALIDGKPLGTSAPTKKRMLTREEFEQKQKEEAVAAPKISRESNLGPLGPLVGIDNGAVKA